MAPSASFATGLVFLSAFVVVEGRVPTPMLPPRLFRQRLFTVSNTAMVVVGLALMGSSFFFSPFFVYVQGTSIWSPGYGPCPSRWPR
ncbi:hypothetical protein AAH991_40180 [Microbispora sp. ZYX-F-249]|uniref:MFS transporter n=1 Tax=Microbispora maris TaxID=3144104 RepID=A0ABV0B2Q8_9ACTN